MNWNAEEKRMINPGADENPFEKMHTRDAFYKYATVETAKLIFGNKSLRWSNPKRFNDPFDSQAHFHTEVTEENFPQLMLDRIEELAAAPDEPLFVNETEMATVVRVVRMARVMGEEPVDEERFKQKFFSASKVLWGKLDSQRLSFIPFYDSYYRKCRVLCLACEPDNILMWSHYASNHYGVAFKLRVAEAELEDDPLWLARPVEYKKNATLFADATVVDQVLGITPLGLFNPGDLFKPAYEKFEGWKYENEWRVVDPAHEEIAEGFKDYTFNLEKLEAVYFGMRCLEKDQQEIINLLKLSAPHVKYFKARQHTYDYKIEFDSIIAKI